MGRIRYNFMTNCTKAMAYPMSVPVSLDILMELITTVPFSLVYIAVPCAFNKVVGCSVPPTVFRFFIFLFAQLIGNVKSAIEETKVKLVL